MANPQYLISPFYWIVSENDNDLLKSKETILATLKMLLFIVSIRADTYSPM
ncbi:hypothetical protein J2S16_003363 [Cytobacillus kochii]|nr:hypothetical protein [Cytobacillus kochii]